MSVPSLYGHVSATFGPHKEVLQWSKGYLLHVHCSPQTAVMENSTVLKQFWECTKKYA